MFPWSPILRHCAPPPSLVLNMYVANFFLKTNGKKLTEWGGTPPQYLRIGDQGNIFVFGHFLHFSQYALVQLG